MRKAAHFKVPVVFLTDELKEDWWYMHNDHRLGPRPELLREFRLATEQGLYMCGTDRFVEVANTLVKPTSEQTVAEVEAARAEREERARRVAEERTLISAILQKRYPELHKMSTADSVARTLGEAQKASAADSVAQLLSVVERQRVAAADSLARALNVGELGSAANSLEHLFRDAMIAAAHDTEGASQESPDG